MSTKPKQLPLIPLVVVAFCLLFFALVFRGGMCERYNKKMQRMEMQKRHLQNLRDSTKHHQR
jgi:hypothetical protein